jgi:hypothetical protein
VCTRQPGRILGQICERCDWLEIRCLHSPIGWGSFLAQPCPLVDLEILAKTPRGNPPSIGRLSCPS